MTSDDVPITSEAVLHRELRTLLQRAHDGGVDVVGGWACRNGPERPDYDIVVTEVQKRNPVD